MYFKLASSGVQMDSMPVAELGGARLDWVRIPTTVLTVYLTAEFWTFLLASGVAWDVVTIFRCLWYQFVRIEKKINF